MVSTYLAVGDAKNQMDKGEDAEENGHGNGRFESGIEVVVRVACIDGHMAVGPWNGLDTVGVFFFAGIIPIVTAEDHSGGDASQTGNAGHGHI